MIICSLHIEVLMPRGHGNVNSYQIWHSLIVILTIFGSPKSRHKTINKACHEKGR